jgi:hypothetical protein
VNCVETAAAETGDLKADRVRTDINRGEDGHDRNVFPILTESLVGQNKTRVSSYRIQQAGRPHGKCSASAFNTPVTRFW